MMNLYNLDSKVKKFEPSKPAWQFELSTALAFQKLKEVDEINESNEKVVEYEGLQPRAQLTNLLSNEIHVDTLAIQPGVTVITADTSGGKTVASVTIANYLAAHNLNVGWFTLQETSKVSEFFPTLKSIADTLLLTDTLPDVIIIDSFRLVQFAIAGGSTRAAGVSSRLFELLTELDNAAQKAGLCLIILFNPMSKDEIAAATLQRDVASSVSTVIELTDNGTGTLTSRLRDTRTPVNFTVRNLAAPAKQQVSETDTIHAKRSIPSSKPFNTNLF